MTLVFHWFQFVVLTELAAHDHEPLAIDEEALVVPCYLVIAFPVSHRSTRILCFLGVSHDFLQRFAPGFRHER